MTLRERIVAWWRPRPTGFQERRTAWFNLQHALDDRGGPKAAAHSAHQSQTGQEPAGPVIQRVPIEVAHPNDAIQAERDAIALVDGLRIASKARPGQSFILHGYQRQGESGPEKRN